ncbi:MAG: tetratricopeptide repeat protein, partial [Cyanobacteria bacterium J06649_4]
MLLGFVLVTAPVSGYALEKPHLPNSSLQNRYTQTSSSQSSQALSSPQRLIAQGREHYKSQRFTAAAAAWSQAATLLALDNDQLQQALALSYLSAAEQQLGHWEAANTHIYQSMELISGADATAQPTSIVPISAQVQNTLGGLQFAKGDTQLALETWQSAERLYLQLDDQPRYLNNLLNQVQAQQVLGYYHQAGNTLVTLERYLPQQSLPLQIRGYQRLGQIYRLIGNLDRAIAHLNTALTLAQQTDENPASILIELGNTKQSQGDFAGAIALYQQAIAQSTTPDTQLKAQLNQLQVLSKSDPIEARRAIASLSTGLATLPPGRNQTYAYIHAAQSLMTLGNPSDLDTAARWLAQAVQASIELKDSRAEAYARGALGHIYEKSQRWREAQSLTEDALTTARTINAADIAYQWEWQLGRLFKQQNQKEKALQSYRSAYATLQSIKQDLVATNQDLQFSFRDSVEPVYRELVDLLLQPDPLNPGTVETNGLASSNNFLSVQAEARNVIESLQVAELDNFFRTACLEGQQVALEDVEKTDAAIVYPIILSDRLEILVSLPDQPLQQYTSLVTQTELEQTLT